MNNLSRAAFLISIVAMAFAYFLPEWRAVSIGCAAIAAAVQLCTREIGHRRNKRLAATVAQLGGSVKDLGSTVEGNHPKLNVAAAFLGQGELATWNYSTLIQRMQDDGHLPRPPLPNATPSL